MDMRCRGEGVITTSINSPYILDTDVLLKYQILLCFVCWNYHADFEFMEVILSESFWN